MYEYLFSYTYTLHLTTQVEMASRGRGSRGRLRGAGQAPPTFDQSPVFDQQTFAEAVGIAAAAIAQASIASSQGGPSNL